HTAKSWPPARGAREIIDNGGVIGGGESTKIQGRISEKVGGRQVEAVPKRIVFDAGDAVGNGDAEQAHATVKRLGSDAGDAAGNGNDSQGGAERNGIVYDHGDTVANRDAG